MFTAALFDTQIDNPYTAWRMNRIAIAKETGWTLDYIDSLPFEDLRDLTAYNAGFSKARAHRQKQNESKAKRGHRRR